MADELPEGMPPGWFLDHKIRKDGTVERFYHNIQTGQKFNTKQEMMRFARYKNNISPHLDAHFGKGMTVETLESPKTAYVCVLTGDGAFNECYMDDKGRYVERPWENDPVHSFKDYVEGRAGKLKDKLESECSSITSDARMPEKPQQKAKGKGKKK